MQAAAVEAGQGAGVQVSEAGTVEQAFRARLDRARGSARLFPYFMWCATLDPRTPTSCRELDGKVWRVGDERLTQAVAEHFAGDVAGCRCVGMALRESDVQRRGLQVIR